MGIRLNYLYLVASFAIGLAVMMLTIPKPRVVLKFPSTTPIPMYTRSDNACYKISADEEDCPADGKHVRSQPVSSDIDETKEGWDYESLNVIKFPSPGTVLPF
jgi:hypothetical protein